MSRLVCEIDHEGRTGAYRITYGKLSRRSDNGHHAVTDHGVAATELVGDGQHDAVLSVGGVGMRGTLGGGTVAVAKGPLIGQSRSGGRIVECDRSAGAAQRIKCGERCHGVVNGDEAGS